MCNKLIILKQSQNKTTPILIVGLTNKQNLSWCANNNVSITVESKISYNELKDITLKTPLKIHFKINTGLNRYGFSNTEEFLEIYKKALQNKFIEIEGIFTHFATTENEQSFIIEQYDAFKTYLNKIINSNIIVHCCNSYAYKYFTNMHHNMIRCGFDLFGYSNQDELKPVLEIKSKIVALQYLKIGDTIGYERSFKAEKPMTIGIVPMGYGDGFDRRCSNNVSVIVSNKKAKVVGYVCMDAFMIDLTKHKNIKILDEVIILGKTNDFDLSPQYYAKKLSTSPYEIFLKFKKSRMKLVLKK
jgi:alanine racemase